MIAPGLSTHVWLLTLVTSYILGMGFRTTAADESSEEENENPLRRDDLIVDPLHILEHLHINLQLEDAEKMPKKEAEFHYFQSHDLNADNMLDGLELLAALDHSSERQIEMVKEMTATEEVKAQRMAKINHGMIKSVDRILIDDDANNDGYLSYMEYQVSRKATKILKMNSVDPKPRVGI